MQVMSQTSPYYDYEHILGACAEANPLVKNLDLDYALFIVLPLNLIKNTAVLIVTFFVYKGIHKALRWEKPVQNEEPEVIDVEAK
jgi:riboflavin transporter FmnP